MPAHAARPRHRRLVSLAIVVVGVGALVAALLMYKHRGYTTPSEFGVVPVAQATTPAPTSDTPSTSPVAPSTTASSKPSATKPKPAKKPSKTSPRPGAEPTHITISDLHVNSSVVPIGVTNGALDIPEDVTKIGWWKDSAKAGSSQGSVVLTGHVDSAQEGIGALFYLDTLKQGSAVRLQTDDGEVDYKVVARRVFEKTAVPHDVFRQNGTPQLVIITCGGPFDKKTLVYRDNVVVYAVPA